MDFPWYHYDEKKSRFVQVKTSSGGGTRSTDMKRSSNYNECRDMGTSFFFHRGKSSKGRLSSLLVELAAFDLGELGEEILVNGKNQPFTIQNYIYAYGLKKVKFVIKTKNYDIGNVFEISDEETEDCTDEKPASDGTEINSQNASQSALIGNSAERRYLRQQQDAEYLASLAADQEKERKRAEEEKNKTSEEKQRNERLLREQLQKVAYLEGLRKARESRVPPEPSVEEEHVVVIVQHLQEGRKLRMFRPTDRLLAVYDWIGGINSEPEFFGLSFTPSAEAVLPEESVMKAERRILYMTKQDTPLPLSLEENEISFLGYHKDVYDDETATELYKEIEKKRQSLHDLLNQDPKEVLVSRETVFKDMMKLYQDDPFLKDHVIVVRFKDESTDGDGLGREAFSCFMDELLFNSCEEYAEFVPIMQPDFSIDEFRIIVTIFYHFFVNFGVFPLQLSVAAFILLSLVL